MDCSHGMFNYGCNGGDPYAAIEYIFEKGVPHSSCQQYAARNNVENTNLLVDTYTCEDTYICRDCTPPIPTVAGEGLPENCYTPKKFTLYYVDSFGNATTEAEMKGQLTAFGPLGCGIQATDELENKYTGGIWKQLLPAEPVINHEVAVVGWGIDDSTKEEYWIVRNSWGTYWGDYGFFKLPVSDDPKKNLGI